MERRDNDGGDKPPPGKKDNQAPGPGPSRGSGYSSRRSPGDRPPGDPPRPQRDSDRSSGPRRESGGYTGRRPEGGAPERGPRREGGGYQGRRSQGGAPERGPRREGGGYQGRPSQGGAPERGPRREGGGYQGRPSQGGAPERGPRREGGGYQGGRPEGGADRGPRREGGGYQGRRSEGGADRGPRREGGGYQGRRSEGGAPEQDRRDHYRAADSSQSTAQAPAEHKLKLVATCALGLELIVGRELEALGLGPISRDNAQVSFPFSPHNLAKANYWLRSADRVWLQLAEFPCRDFEELYQGVHSVEWADMLPQDAWFPLEVITTKSTLESVPSCQAVAKKAAVEKMSLTYGRSHFPEIGAKFAIRVFIVYNRARVFIDTSGEGLHRRGYRTYNAKAPLRETVAAALVMLSHWHPSRELYDPMCGSGTILLEAAAIGLKKATGIDRSFASQRWDWVGRTPWEETHQEALDLFDRRGHLRIYGSDIDGRVLKLAREHLTQSGFEGQGVHFQTRDVKDFSSNRKHGVIITNPPYGKRLGSEQEVRELTETMATVFEPLHETWSLYFFTAFAEFQEIYGRVPERVRKIYNGTIPCQFYQYPGPKPPNFGSDDDGGGSEPVRKRIRLNP